MDADDRAIIRTSGTVFAKVITGTDGNDSISNLGGGFIRGSIDLGTGANAFLNGSGSLYETGNDILFGAGNTFTNEGSLSFGGRGRIMNDSTVNRRVDLLGNFTQTSTGELLTDLNVTFSTANDDFADFVNVSRDVVLGDFITSNPATGAGSLGDFIIPLVTGASLDATAIRINSLFATATPSTTVTFMPFLEGGGLNGVFGDTLFLRFATEFAPPDLTLNQLRYATLVNAIQTVRVACDPDQRDRVRVGRSFRVL